LIKYYNNSEFWEVIEKLFKLIRKPDNIKFAYLLDEEQGEAVLEIIEIVEQNFYELLHGDEI